MNSYQKAKANKKRPLLLRQQYEPRKYAIAPEGKSSIYRLCGLVARIDHATGQMHPFKPAFDAAPEGIAFGYSLELMQKLCDMYNAGERWYDNSLVREE